MLDIFRAMANVAYWSLVLSRSITARAGKLNFGKINTH